MGGQVRLTDKDLGFLVDDFLNQFDALSAEDRAVAYHELTKSLPGILREKRDAARKEVAARQREKAQQAKQAPEALPIHEAIPNYSQYDRRGTSL